MTKYNVVDLFKINKLKETLTNYLKVKIELFKLDFTEHLANLLAQVIAYFIIILIATIIIAFLSIALAQYLNGLFGSNTLGFLAVAGLYLLWFLAILYYLKSGKLKSMFESALMDDIFSSETDEK